MACEVPCVVTDVGDCQEVVGDAGRVVAANDMQGLAVHLLDLLQLPPAQRAALGQRARERVAANYEVRDVVRPTSGSIGRLQPWRRMWGALPRESGTS